MPIAMCGKTAIGVGIARGKLTEHLNRWHYVFAIFADPTLLFCTCLRHFLTSIALTVSLKTNLDVI